MYYENYRHSVNSLLMYNILRENGVPDEHVSNKFNKIFLFELLDYLSHVRISCM